LDDFKFLYDPDFNYQLDYNNLRMLQDAAGRYFVDTKYDKAPNKDEFETYYTLFNFDHVLKTYGSDLIKINSVSTNVFMDPSINTFKYSFHGKSFEKLTYDTDTTYEDVPINKILRAYIESIPIFGELSKSASEKFDRILNENNIARGN